VTKRTVKVFVESRKRRLYIALLWGWFIPGGGHYYLGQKWQGILLGSLLFLLYLAGFYCADYRNVSLSEPFYLMGYSFAGSFTALALLVGFCLDTLPQWQPFAYQLGYLYITTASFLNLLILLRMADIRDESL
jgi:hypothetical protein